MTASTTDKIHLGLTPQGDFEIRMPREAVAALYRMICGTGLQERRTFWQVKTQLEEHYRDLCQLTPKERGKEEKAE